MRKLPLLLALVTLLPCTLAAQYTLVDHPRMFLTRATLPALAARAYGAGMPAEDYAMIKAEADYLVAQGQCRKLESVWHRPTDMLCAALAYLIERERGNPAADQYAAVVKTIWGDGRELSNIGSGHFGSFALAFDWIYDYLTPAERKTFGNRLVGWLYWYATDPITGVPVPEIALTDGGWLYNQTWGPSHLNTPNTRDGITPKLFVALALAGAGTDYDAACTQFLDSWNSRIPLECIPQFDRMGGVWAESMGHGSYGPTLVIPWAFEAWRTATGLDWFQLGTADTYLKDMNRWAVHLTVPFYGYTAPIDDNQGERLEESWYMTAPILASRYRDPVAARLAAGYDRGVWPTDWFTIPWLRFLTFDPSLPQRTPGSEGWETAHLFEGAGHLYLRSAWDDPDATWAFFGAGPWMANHSRDDEGHFMIAKKGWLVLRGGGMGHNDGDYYAGGSLIFNLVTIFNPSERFDRTDPGVAGGVKNERDGGLIRHVYGHDHQELIERGEMVAYKHTPRWTYAAADLTKGYLASKVDEVTRQILYLRGEREFFLIFDRVDARRTDYPKTWFLHLPSEPEVTGTAEVQVAGHVYRYREAGAITWLSDPAGWDNQVLSQGRSRAFLRTVLPDSALLTKRGGVGHDFWGHPHEPTAQYNHVGSESGQNPQVPWRLEVEAPVGTDRQYFLHVLEIGAEADQAMSALSRLDDVAGQTGVRIVTAGGEAIEVRFPLTGPLAAEVKLGAGSLPQQLPAMVDTTARSALEGDYDYDGRVALSDVVHLLVRALRHPGDPWVDVDGDGRWSIADALRLLLRVRAQEGTMLAAAAGPSPLAAGLSSAELARVRSLLRALGLDEAELAAAEGLLAAGSALPRAFALEQNYPNPFNPSTTISYSVGEDRAVPVRLEVFNLRGALVRVLADRVHAPGHHQVHWDGADREGRPVPSGVYFYRLSDRERSQTRKMVLVR